MGQPGQGGGIVRFNRDSLRSMLFVDSPWNHRNEDLTRKYEEEGIRLALSMGLNVVVDDTNCVSRTRQRLEQIARSERVKFCITMMNTDKAECVRRNSERTGEECVPVEAIERQFKNLCEASVIPAGYAIEEHNRAVGDRQALRSRINFVLRLPDAPVVLCDIDGTVAEKGERSQFDETQVLLDTCREPVAAWLRALYPTHNIIMVSGRHNTCSTDTCTWLEGNKVSFDYILMRPAGSYLSDHIVKQAILDELLAVLPKEQIAFVIDDRWKVVEMWRANGLKVYPVGGTIQHSETCKFQPDKKGWRHCPECGALEDF